MLRYCFVLIFLLPIIVFAQNERPGSTSAQFLKIGVSPRGSGMAGAYIASVEGAESTFYNPAIIAELSGTDIVFNHNEWFADINHEYFSIASNFGDYGSFAISVVGFYTDEMKVRTPLQPDGTGETFYAGAYQFGLTYARKLTNNVSFGGSLKYLNYMLYEDFAENALTTDIAVNYTASFRNLRFALGIFNFGESMKFVNEEYPMPTVFIFGMSIDSWQSEDYVLKISGSAKKPNEGAPLGQTGMELEYLNSFFVRAGYNIGHDIAKYAFGLGFHRNLIDDFRVRIDYSFNNFRYLGNAHRFGIGMSF